MDRCFLIFEHIKMQEGGAVKVHALLMHTERIHWKNIKSNDLQKSILFEMKVETL